MYNVFLGVSSLHRSGLGLPFSIVPSVEYDIETNSPDRVPALPVAFTVAIDLKCLGLCDWDYAQMSGQGCGHH